MNKQETAVFMGSSGIIAVVMTLIATLFADAIAGALSSREPDWLYIAFVVTLGAVVILLNLVVHLFRGRRSAATHPAGSAPGDVGADAVTRGPAEFVSLGDGSVACRQ